MDTSAVLVSTNGIDTGVAFLGHVGWISTSIGTIGFTFVGTDTVFKKIVVIRLGANWILFGKAIYTVLLR